MSQQLSSYWLSLLWLHYRIWIQSVLHAHTSWSATVIYEHLLTKKRARVCWQACCLQTRCGTAGHPRGGGRVAGERRSRVSWVMTANAAPNNNQEKLLVNTGSRAGEFVCVFRTLPDLPERDEPPVLFQSLLPPEADRRTVSNIFQRLLGELSLNHPITHVETVLMFSINTRGSSLVHKCESGGKSSALFFYRVSTGF